MKQRRDFLKSLGLAGLGITIASPLSAYGNIMEQKQAVPLSNLPSKQSSGKQTVSILQTTDVHCQVHPHDELFWENGQIVFRKTGGYANVSEHDLAVLPEQLIVRV